MPPGHDFAGADLLMDEIGANLTSPVPTRIWMSAELPRRIDGRGPPTKGHYLRLYTMRPDYACCRADGLRSACAEVVLHSANPRADRSLSMKSYQAPSTPGNETHPFRYG